MRNWFKNKNYINELVSFFNDIGYRLIESHQSQNIPKELFKESKFKLIELYNREINKKIELYITSLNTIHKIQLLDLNHSNLQDQYNATVLSIDISQLTTIDYLQTYGFKTYGKEQFERTIKSITEIGDYIQTAKAIPEHFNTKFPKDRKELKTCLNSLLLPLDFEIHLDFTKYNPYYSKPFLTYAKADLYLNFKRITTRDENFISFNYNYKTEERKFVYLFGKYEPARAFNFVELEQFKHEIKKQLHITLGMT